MEVAASLKEIGHLKSGLLGFLGGDGEELVPKPRAQARMTIRETVKDQCGWDDQGKREGEGDEAPEDGWGQASKGTIKDTSLDSQVQGLK